jgi:hypothetical protein
MGELPPGALLPHANSTPKAASHAVRPSRKYRFTQDWCPRAVPPVIAETAENAPES